MKSIKWALIVALTAMATPALAATELETGTRIVWIALGVVFLGALLAIFGSFLAASGSKNKTEAQKE